MSSTTDDLRLEMGENYYLSLIRRGDKEACLRHLRDPEISRNTLTVPFPYTEADADAWLQRCEEQSRIPEERFAVREPGGELIGVIGLVGTLAEDGHRAEFGYWLAKPYRGRGLMPRAIRVFAAHVFRELGLHRLYATSFVPNLASQRALEKAGFQREGLLRQHHRKDGVYLDAVLYALLADDEQALESKKA
jgi:ribosomal-protein-alanine N-acetyltransferase